MIFPIFAKVKKKTFADILNDYSDADAARMRRKVPEWADIPGLSFPSRLSTEQCSSEATAGYKAALVSRIGADSAATRIVDLTGGLGVDCWAFSKVAAHVHHNEMDTSLSEAVRANFSLLGVTNSSFSAIEVSADTLDMVIEAAGGADIVFLDPARRSESGRKVFLLEDCRPDVLSLKERILAAVPEMLVKLSPMADITMVCRRLGDEVREIHVLGTDGECKEIVVRLSRGWNGGYEIHAAPSPDCGTIKFTPDQEASASISLPASQEDLAGHSFLFEPSPVLLKSACFNLLCSLFGLKKIGRFTHLYTSAEAPDILRDYGKLFTINELLPFNGSSIKSIAQKYPRCEVTARNLPLSSDALRKKMGVTSGGDTHIFAFTADFSNAASRRLMAVTSRL